MKIKEVIQVLNEFSKVAGEDCEVQLYRLSLVSSVEQEYSYGYSGPTTRKLSWLVIAKEYPEKDESRQDQSDPTLHAGGM